MRILILEDGKEKQKQILQTIPKGIDYTIVKNQKEFNNYLKKNKKAELYFLDDDVPTLRGWNFPIFDENYTALRKHDQNGKVFYIGDLPLKHEEDFCREAGVEIIKTNQIPEKIQEYLK